MLHLYDRETIEHALTLDLEPTLRRLLQKRIDALGEDLIDWTDFLVVQPGDTEADIIRHVGFSPMVEPIEGKRFGQEGFHPFWDWLADHGSWFEMIVTFGSTFAYVLFIANPSYTRDPLATLCDKFLNARN